MIRSPAHKPHPESLAIGAVLTVLVAMGQISMSVYIPSLPALAVEFDTTQARVNLTLAGFLLGFAAFQLVYGPLSDRFGRRRVLMGGMVLYTAASLWCAFVTSVDALIIARFAQGVGACAGPVIGRAVVRDVYGKDRSAKAMAYIGAALSISPAVTPVLGGYLQLWWGWPSVFVFSAGLGACVIIAVWALLQETNADPDHRAVHVRPMIGNFSTLLKSRAFMGYVAAVTGSFGTLMAFTAASPFIFINGLAMAPHHYGALSVFTVIGFLVGSMVAGRKAQAWGAARSVLIGLGLAVLGGAVMVAVAAMGVFSITAIIAPMMVCLAGMGLVLANGMAGALTHYPQMTGAASGMMGCLQMAAAAAISVVAGRLDKTTQMPMAVLILGVAVLATAVFLVTVWPSRDTEKRL